VLTGNLRSSASWKTVTVIGLYRNCFAFSSSNNNGGSNSNDISSSSSSSNGVGGDGGAGDVLTGTPSLVSIVCVFVHSS
jgi:hypothetical protein